MHVVVIVVATALTVRTQLGLLDVLPAVPGQFSVVGSLLGVTACLSLLLIRWRVPALMVIGAFSFTVYTCHVFATAAVRQVLFRVGIESTSVHMIVGVVAGVAFGIAVELLARRNGWAAAALLGRRWPTGASRGRSSAGTISLLRGEDDVVGEASGSPRQEG